MSSDNRPPPAPLVVTAVGTFFLSWAVISYGFGWMSAGTADTLANARAEEAVKIVAVATLGRDCADKARADPDSTKMAAVAALEQPSQQVNEIVKVEWVTFPDFPDIKLSTANQRAVAGACRDLLFPAKAAASTG